MSTPKPNPERIPTSASTPAPTPAPASAEKQQGWQERRQERQEQVSKGSPRGGVSEGDTVSVFVEMDQATQSDVAPATVTKMYGQNPNDGSQTVDLHVWPDSPQVTSRTSVALFETKDEARTAGGQAAWVGDDEDSDESSREEQLKRQRGE